MEERTVNGTEQELMQGKKYDEVNVCPMYTRRQLMRDMKDTWLLNQCKCVNGSNGFASFCKAKTLRISGCMMG